MKTVLTTLLGLLGEMGSPMVPMTKMDSIAYAVQDILRGKAVRVWPDYHREKISIRTRMGINAAQLASIAQAAGVSLDDVYLWPSSETDEQQEGEYSGATNIEVCLR